MSTIWNFGDRARRTVAVTAAISAAALVLSGCSLLFEPAHTPKGSVVGGEFADQVPDWQSCYDGFECATVEAPLDWADPGGERIRLALVKQPALGGDPIGSLFVNPGGPGASGVNFIAESIDFAVGEPLQQAYDVIGWDPRGVQHSTPVKCLDAADMDEELYGLGDTFGLEVGSQQWIDESLEEVADFGEACLEATGNLLAHVDTGSTVQDLDMLRAIVGDDTLNYLGYSYGTFIGALYAEAYPQRVGRLVLDGAIDPAATLEDVVREQTIGFELSLRAYVTDCLTRDECPLTGNVDQAMAQWRALLDRVDANPLTGNDGRPLTSSTLLTAIITPLYSRDSWSYLDELFVTVSQGDAETALFLADFYYDRENGEYLTNQTEAFTATNCLDYPRPPLDVERMRQQAAELEQLAPTIGVFQGYSDVGCASWPVPAADQRGPVTAAGADPILVIGTTGDPATPYKWAEALADQLQSGVLLTYEGEGHTAYGGNDCVNDIVESYLLTGATPRAGTVCS